MPEAPSPTPSEEAKSAAASAYGDLIDSAVRDVKGEDTPAPIPEVPAAAEPEPEPLPMHETQAKLMADIEAKGIREAAKVKSKPAKEKRIAAARARAEAAAAVFVDKAQAGYETDAEKAEKMAYAESGFRDTAAEFKTKGEEAIAKGVLDAGKASAEAVGAVHEAETAEAERQRVETKRKHDGEVVAFTANIRQRSDTGRGTYSVTDHPGDLRPDLATSFSKSEVPFYTKEVKGKGGKFEEVYYTSSAPANSNLVWVERYNTSSGKLISINVIAAPNVSRPSNLGERLAGWRGQLMTSRAVEQQMKGVRETEANKLGRVGARLGRDYRGPNGEGLVEHVISTDYSGRVDVPDFLKLPKRRATAKPRNSWWQIWR